MEYILDGPQSKLTLLFLLDKMEIPLTQFNLLDICTSTNQWLGYMDCIEIIDQLLNAKFIFKTDDEGQEIRYGITYEGRACLSDFYQRIPASLREKITVYAKENSLNLKRSQEYVSEYSNNPDGSYTVTLKIKEPMVQLPLLEIKLKAPSRSSAKLACNKWSNKAQNIFEVLYDNLIDN
ncbi:MAG: DUF4364 family protein [Clostridiales bacterium]|nr:DUF4364 family protein [Clostridiales bacterium]